jgi:hypothetical protein
MDLNVYLKIDAVNAGTVQLDDGSFCRLRFIECNKATML